jgi:hypothetical protein
MHLLLLLSVISDSFNNFLANVQKSFMLFTEAAKQFIVKVCALVIILKLVCRCARRVRANRGKSSMPSTRSGRMSRIWRRRRIEPTTPKCQSRRRNRSGNQRYCSPPPPSADSFRRFFKSHGLNTTWSTVGFYTSRYR